MSWSKLVYLSFLSLSIFFSQNGYLFAQTKVTADSLADSIGLDIDVSQILLEELGNVALESQKIARQFGVKSIPVGTEVIEKKAVDIGMKMVAGRLKDEMFATTIEVPIPLATVSYLIQEAIWEGRKGKIIKVEDTENYSLVSGSMGSGFLNMNPAVIIAIFKAGDEQNTVIFLKGFAKEGMIKQKTAEKSVRKVIQALTDYSKEEEEYP